MEKHGSELVSLKNVSVFYQSIPVLKNISLDIYPGEIHSIVGENGAGKSTLMKTIFGIISPEKGEVIFLQIPRTNQTVHQIIQSGISMIHQELMLVPECTVEENIFLGQEKYGSKQKCYDLLTEFNCSFHASDLVKNLSIANQQMVEIIRAVSQKAKLILMDEPTSSLTDQELETFYKLIEKLKSENVAILFTSHKMQEIFAISDKISVLRDGQLISTNKASQINLQELVAQMVGRDIPDFFPKRTQKIVDEVLVVQQLTDAQHKFNQISFSLHKGEVLGLAGLVGAGRTEIGLAIAGLRKIKSGEILLKKELLKNNSPKNALNKGIAYLGEDRKATGFIPQFSIAENISLSSLATFQRWGILQREKEKIIAQSAIQKFSIKSLYNNQPVSQLSGGNQQKVVLAKVLQTNPDIIILDEPTRGIDVRSKHEIYLLINELVSLGKAVLLISSDLPELINLCDRMLIISKGKQTAILSKTEFNPEKIIHFAMQSYE